MSVDFDGCRFGVVDDRGQPIKKPWRLMTTSPEIVEAFKGIFCKHKPAEARLGVRLENALDSTHRPCANS